ncbi:hypothetical protein [Allobaculum stercoricanis]|uniref:hypothetical protein n=1 Tax=Allobaculum stercoricanis TaxID=174709 RepID=UPI0023F53982|nr:hypothetical protein [Allobaculum stercoricanis]
MKIKNKKRLIVLSTLYIVGYLYFCIFGGINYGMKISDHTALEMIIVSLGIPVVVRNLSITIFIWIIVSFFLVLFIIWQSDLTGPKLTRTTLICQGINLLFICLSRGIVEWIVGGVADGLFTMLIIFAVLFFLVGAGIGITYFVNKKTGRLNSYEAFSDILTEDEFEQWKK